MLEGHSGGVTSVCVSVDGKSLFSSSWEQTVRDWDQDLASGLDIYCLLFCILACVSSVGTLTKPINYYDSTGISTGVQGQTTILSSLTKLLRRGLI